MELSDRAPDVHRSILANPSLPGPADLPGRAYPNQHHPTLPNHITMGP